MLTPQDVFERPTVERLAAVVGAAGAGDASDRGARLAEITGGGVGAVEPTPVLRWLGGRHGEWDHFSQSVTVRIPAGITGAQLRVALQSLLDRHDMLRATRLGSGADLHLSWPNPARSMPGLPTARGLLARPRRRGRRCRRVVGTGRRRCPSRPRGRGDGAGGVV